MKNINLGRRFKAAFVASVAAGPVAIKNTLETAVKEVSSTVIDTIEAPFDDVKNGEFYEAPFDMLVAAFDGSVNAVSETLKALFISPIVEGAKIYCTLAGEDANPKTVDFVERNKQ